MVYGASHTIYLEWWKREGELFNVTVTLFFLYSFCFEKKTKWGCDWEQVRQDRRDRPGDYFNRWYTTGNTHEKPLFNEKNCSYHPEFQRTHKGVTRPFRILSTWYQELKDRFLEVIKFPGFGGSMVSCFPVQLYGERMNLPDVEVMMYKPCVMWTVGILV